MFALRGVRNPKSPVKGSKGCSHPLKNETCQYIKMTNNGTSYRYTIGQFMSLNDGCVSLTPELEDIFRRYAMPPCSLEVPYNNRHNIHFYPKGSTPTESKLGSRSAYSDSNIICTLNHALSSVVKGNDGTVMAIATISQILIPDTMVDQVAKLFYDTILQSPKQTTEYLRVLFGLLKPNNMKAIHLAFVKMAMGAFKTPVKLEDTILESGASRSKKHRETTCLLIASLFAYKFNDKNPMLVQPALFFGKRENLEERFLCPLLEISRSDPDSVKILAHAWTILTPLWGDVLKKYHPTLTEIYNNPDFKISVRLLLRDLVGG